MQASIFTTGSNTVNKDSGDDATVEEYFQGLFTTVPTLAEKLREYGEVDIHVLSDELGYVTGSDRVGDVRPPSEGAAERMQETLVAEVESSDVVALMLTNPTYERVLIPVWNTLVSESRDDLVWFVSASPSILSELELEELDGDVVVYERIGVTRISNEAEEEFLEVVESGRAVNG